MKLLSGVGIGLGMAVAGSLACSPPTEDLAYLRAVNAVDDERFDLARPFYDAHLESHPGHLQALRGAGRAWMAGALQSVGHAERQWKAVLAAEPDDDEAHRELANTSYLRGQLADALSHLGRVAPDPAAERLRATVLLQADPAAAVELVERLAETAIEAELAVIAAQANELLGRDTETLRWAQRAVELDPLVPMPHYLLSRSLQRRGEKSEAAREARIHQLLQSLAVSQGTTKATAQERLRIFDELAPMLDPASAHLKRLRLAYLADAGMRAQGRELLSEALSDAEHWGTNRSRLAAWAERLGDLRSASRLLEEELPTVTERETRRALRHRLARLYRATEPERAEPFLRAALEDEPHAARHHCMLGELLLESGRTEEASRSLARALDLAPWRADCRLSLARILHVRGERRAVIELLAQAPEPDPGLAQFIRQFGYETQVSR